MKARLLHYLTIGMLLCAGFANAATTYTWNGGASGNWNTAGNWKIGASVAATYPGQSGTTDIAVVNTSNATLTLTTTATIGSLQSSTFSVSNITVSVSTGNTLTISGNVSTAQPSSAATAFTFSGLGTTKVTGTLSASFNASYAIAANATLTLASGAIFDESSGNPHGNINNAGTLNLQSGAAVKLGDNASLINSGTVVAASTAFTLNGSPSGITNTGTIRATSCTFTLTGSGMTFSNSSTATFITDKCSLTSNNSTVPISNAGAWTDHGSTFSFTGQTNTITNSGASANFHGSGTTITFSSANNNHSFTNSSSATCKLDSGSTLNMGTQNCVLTNSATFYAGTSNSKCTINLTGQGSNISNTATFYEGSTSVIAPSGTSANITNSAAGSFTLQSDASGSATISALSGTASVTGTYKVERYLQGGVGHRSYRLLSSQVFVTNVASANVYSINYLKNSIYLTGTTTTGGFDNTSAANPTLYLYAETITNPMFSTFLNSNFVGISKINNATSYAYSVNSVTYSSTYYIPVGSGFLCFFRGDRSTSFTNKTSQPFPVPENTTLTTSGTINTGTLTARNWFNQASATLSYTAGTNANYRGFNLVGNPYPSTIDWETYSNTAGSGIYVKNVSKTVYELNPQTQNFDVYQKGGAFTNNGSRYIASGQGFFVLDTLAGGFLGFNESAKVNNLNTGVNLFMGTPDEQTMNSQYLRLQLAMDTINTDDMVLRFNSGVSSYYKSDLDAAYKTGLGKVSLSSLSGDHVALAINTRALPKKADTIGLVVNASANGVYSLNMKQLVGVPQLYDIWLMDKYKKDSLDIRHNATYSFNVYKNDTTSFGSNRFALVIRQNPALAYHLLSFTAAKATSATNSSRHVLISWTSENEQNYTYFTVERSIDNGNSYQVAGSLTASGLGNYGLTDENPAAANLYRLKSVDINGAITYSYIVPIMYTPQTGLLQNIGVYPNPVGSTLNVAIAAGINATDTYKITITNSTGLLVKQGTSTQPNWQTSASGLLPGTYVVKVFNNKTQTEIGNTKFVKL